MKIFKKDLIKKLPIIIRGHMGSRFLFILGCQK